MLDDGVAMVESFLHTLGIVHHHSISSRTCTHTHTHPCADSAAAHLTCDAVMVLEESQVMAGRGQEVRESWVCLQVSCHSQGEQDLSQPADRQTDTLWPLGWRRVCVCVCVCVPEARLQLPVHVLVEWS